MSNVDKLHPKMIAMFGKIYVDRYLKNPEEAIAWAQAFFPSDMIDTVVAASKEELKKRGVTLK